MVAGNLVFEWSKAQRVLPLLAEWMQQPVAKDLFLAGILTLAPPR